MSLFAWLSWSIPSASASAEVVVRTDRACIVVVNFAPYPTSQGSVVVRLPDGREGEQHVRVRNLLGEQQWAGEVTVGPGQRAVLSWEGGSMSRVGVEPLPIEARRPPPPPRPAPAPRPKPEVPPAAPIEDPVLQAVLAAAREGSPAPPPEAPVPPPEEGWPAELSLVNRTGSWANVVVDGERFEFRGETTRSIPLGSGVHRVTIGDFRDQPWWSGELWVEPESSFELQFSQASPPAVPGRPDLWRP